MYALPPSPTRPAPVLDRAPSSSTLMRQPPRPVRPTRVSISEGEITDGQPPPPAVLRQPGQPRGGVRYGVVKRASTKRQAPSPPGRRVVSSDREERLVANGRAVYGNGGIHHPESNYRNVQISCKFRCLFPGSHSRNIKGQTLETQDKLFFRGLCTLRESSLRNLFQSLELCELELFPV